MKATRRGPVTLVFAVMGAAVLGLAAVAWACTPAAYISSINPESAPSGSRVSLTASRFNPGPVEIRWNDTDGALLATAQGPAFSVSFTVPPANPGTYTVLAVQRAGTTIVGKAPIAFQVTPASAVNSGGHTSSTGGGDSAGGGQPASGSTTSSEASQDGSAPAGSRSAAPSTASSSGGAAFPAETSGDATTATATDPGTGAGTNSAASSPAARAGSPAAAPTEGAGRPNGATASSGILAGNEGERAADASATATEPGASPSARSLATDLWSGFDQGTSGGNVSLTDTPAVPVSPAAVAAGMFSAALVALFGGFGVAELRRRRAPANASQGR